jgi:hypothetical protein
MAKSSSSFKIDPDRVLTEPFTNKDGSQVGVIVLDGKLNAQHYIDTHTKLGYKVTVFPGYITLHGPTK